MLAHLGGSLEMLDTVPVNIVVGTDGLSQLRRDDHTRSVGGWTSGEQHDSSTSVGERILLSALLGLHTHLEKGNSDSQGDTGTSQRSLVLFDGPRVSLKTFKNVGQLEFTFLNLEQEPRSRRGGHGLSRSRRGSVGGIETEHIGDLLGLVFF